MKIINDDAERANIQFVKIKDDHDDDDGSLREYMNIRLYPI